MSILKKYSGSQRSTHGALLLMYCAMVASHAQAQCIVFGTYSSLPSVSYSCESFIIPPPTVVIFNYSAWEFTNQGSGNIRVTGSPGGSPPALTGTINCNDSTFAVSATVPSGPGGCTETYSLQGRFTSDTSWGGTFRVMFTGSGCGVTNCLNQTFPVSGTTPHVTGVSNEPIPVEASLDQNFPNPFNPSTQIGFSLSHSSTVTLTIYDILGRHVETLVNERLSAGFHSIQWNADGLSSGVYYYRLTTDQTVQTKHLVLLR